MTVFTEHLVEANRDLWMAMAGHPFVLGLADGTLPDSALQAWVRKVASTLAQVPSVCQRANRLSTVSQGPYRSGRSRHGIPVRVRNTMPLRTWRWSRQRPPR